MANIAVHIRVHDIPEDPEHIHHRVMRETLETEKGWGIIQRDWLVPAPGELFPSREYIVIVHHSHFREWVVKLRSDVSFWNYGTGLGIKLVENTGKIPKRFIPGIQYFKPSQYGNGWTRSQMNQEMRKRRLASKQVTTPKEAQRQLKEAIELGEVPLKKRDCAIWLADHFYFDNRVIGLMIKEDKSFVNKVLAEERNRRLSEGLNPLVE